MLLLFKMAANTSYSLYGNLLLTVISTIELQYT